MQSDQPLDHPEPRPSRPGQRLKLLREAAGLSLADVAQQTRITRSRLEALERDDYQTAGPAAAYVVGYFRAYARLLECPVEPWLTDLEQQLRAKAETQEMQAVVEPVLVDSHHHYRLLPWVALLVAGILVWLLGAQFYGAQSQFSGKINSPELLKLSELSAKDSLVKDLVSPAVAPNAADDAVVDITPLPATNPQALTADPQVINIGTEGIGDALLVNASDDCWIEVQDRNGKALIAQLLHSGNNLRLFGVAPFNIKLGNARAVSIWINSRAIPVNPDNERRTLRLVAGP